MVPNKRHVITEINDGLVYWRTYAQLGIDELMVHYGSHCELDVLHTRERIQEELMTVGSTGE